METSGPGRSAAGGRGATAEAWASTRERYLDNLKILLIAGIIAGHALASYAPEAWWLYSDVREATISPVSEGLMLAIAGPFAFLMIPLLFLVAGLLTPPSLRRKGTAAYARERLLRLGVPFAAFVLLWPLLELALFRAYADSTDSYLDRLLRTDEPLQSGPVWFVGTLLVFSLGYAGWVRLRGVPPVATREVRASALGWLAAAVAVSTFLVRLDIPFDSDQYLALNLYEWPGCLALFGLGIAASGSGWVREVPDRLRHRCAVVSLVGAAGFGAFTALGAVLGGIGEDSWTGGWHWDAAVFVALESVLTVFGPVWVLGAAQRHLDRPFRWARPAVGRSAYGAFMLQGLLLTAVSVALRPVAVPAEIKAVAVALIAVVGSFALAWLLVSRVPGVSRVL